MVGQCRAKTLRRVTVETAVAAIGPKKANPANAGLSIQQPMNLSFAGKALLISGTTSGERATADAFAKHGASVVPYRARGTEGTESVGLANQNAN
jgi:hypothetical protein